MKWNAVEVEIILKTQYFTVWYIDLAYKNTRKSDYVTAFCQNQDGIILIFYFFLEVSKIQAESTIISSLAKYYLPSSIHLDNGLFLLHDIHALCGDCGMCSCFLVLE